MVYRVNQTLGIHTDSSEVHSIQMGRQAKDISHLTVDQQNTILTRRERERIAARAKYYSQRGMPAPEAIQGADLKDLTVEERSDRDALRSREKARKHYYTKGGREAPAERIYANLTNLTSEEKADRQREQALTWYHQNRTEDRTARRLEYVREYRIKNADVLRAKDRARRPQKDARRDPLAVLLRDRIRKALAGRRKLGSAVRDLGCTIGELRTHLEAQFTEGMCWELMGRGPKDNPRARFIEVDHIIPLASFDLTDREQFLEACHFTNLQPLWHEDNRAKGDRVVVGGVQVQGRNLRPPAVSSGDTDPINDN